MLKRNWSEALAVPAGSDPGGNKYSSPMLGSPVLTDAKNTPSGLVPSHCAAAALKLALGPVLHSSVSPSGTGTAYFRLVMFAAGHNPFGSAAPRGLAPIRFAAGIVHVLVGEVTPPTMNAPPFTERISNGTVMPWIPISFDTNTPTCTPVALTATAFDSTSTWLAAIALVASKQTSRQHATSASFLILFSPFEGKCMLLFIYYYLSS